MGIRCSQLHLSVFPLYGVYWREGISFFPHVGLRPHDFISVQCGNVHTKVYPIKEAVRQR